MTTLVHSKPSGTFSNPLGNHREEYIASKKNKDCIPLETVKGLGMVLNFFEDDNSEPKVKVGERVFTDLSSLVHAMPKPSDENLTKKWLILLAKAANFFHGNNMYFFDEKEHTVKEEGSVIVFDTIRDSDGAKFSCVCPFTPNPNLKPHYKIPESKKK